MRTCHTLDVLVWVRRHSPCYKLILPKFSNSLSSLSFISVKNVSFVKTMDTLFFYLLNGFLHLSSLKKKFTTLDRILQKQDYSYEVIFPFWLRHLVLPPNEFTTRTH